MEQTKMGPGLQLHTAMDEWIVWEAKERTAPEAREIDFFSFVFLPCQGDSYITPRFAHSALMRATDFSCCGRRPVPFVFSSKARQSKKQPSTVSSTPISPATPSIRNRKRDISLGDERLSTRIK